MPDVNPTLNPESVTGDQALRLSYNQANMRIRVDAGVVVVTPSTPFPVVVSATDSSIKIGNGTGNFVAVNADGSINTEGTAVVTGTVNTNLLGLAAFQTSQYTVGTSAVQLTVVPLTNRSSMSIKVVTTTSSDVVYVGNSAAVTTSTGYPLFNGDSVQLDLDATQTVYVIGSSAGQEVFVMELG